ncbi:HI1506-related protein [Algiphilus sp. W345]|uniref:HI1506-related protein n=1 Tax=Banduia mediterranea TaxID=3075609 RepID=A0ABU2WF73_9GAMM|nr:HI1506-related protein [Algiphilus sp. W345]MDT0496523.1 HI1506-related protein [Algiphilus sp. W345]
MPQFIRITAKPREGFRRAGMHHPATAVDHPIDTLSDEDIAALKGEPRLIVETVEIDTPAPAKKVPAKKVAQTK